MMVLKRGDIFERLEWDNFPKRNALRTLTDQYSNSVEYLINNNDEFKQKWGKYTSARYTTFFRQIIAREQTRNLRSLFHLLLTRYVGPEGKFGWNSNEIQDYRANKEGFYNFLNNSVNSLFWEIIILCKNLNPNDNVYFKDVRKDNPYWGQMKSYADAVNNILQTRHHVAHYWLQYDFFYGLPFIDKTFKKGELWSESKAKWEKCSKLLEDYKKSKTENDIWAMKDIAEKEGFIFAHKFCENDYKIVSENIENIYGILEEAFIEFAKINKLFRNT